MYDSLLLLEKSSDTKKILSSFSNLENLKIICFDVESNFVLSELGLKHELMENYLDINDEQEIENLALELALSWYKKKEFKDILKFKNINLGWLLEVEIQQYIIQIMKYVVGINRIIEKEKLSKIFASHLLNSILKSIEHKEKFIFNTFPKINLTELCFDNVEIPINLGIKKFNFKTSRNFALKIKSFLEQSTNLLFNLKYNNNIKKNKILLLEFNPVQYSNLMHEISSLDDDIILLNERRPAVWNLKSLTTVKNSKSKVLRLLTISDNVSQQIDNERNDLVKKLDRLFSQDDDFINIFRIKNHSFWFAIKEDFVSICNHRFSEAVFRILSSEDFFKKNNIHCILTMYNAGAEERAILSVAQKLKIPSILMQHGIYAQNQYFQKFIPVLGYLPNLEQKEAVWGNETKDHFIKLGIDANNLILAGSPRHDFFFNSKVSKRLNNSILLATNVIVGQNYKGNDSRVHENYKIKLKKLIEIINTVSDKKLIIKLHPGKSTIDIIPKILEEIKFPLNVSKIGNIFDYIVNSDIVICTEFSTVLIDAMILKKPTITLLFDPNDFHDESIIKSGATAYVQNLQEFSDVLNKILSDESFRKNLVTKGSNFIDKYMINQGNSSKFLAQHIHDI